MTTADVDRERLEAWRLFLEAHAYVIDLLEDEMRADEDLPLAWYDVLVHLSEAPEGRLRMQDLAEAVLLSKSGLTRLVDRMEEAGLVSRRACPTDRRGTYAQVTVEGRATLRRSAPAHIRGVREHFTDHLTESEVRALRSAFRKIVVKSGRSSTVC